MTIPLQRVLSGVLFSLTTLCTAMAGGASQIYYEWLGKSSSELFEMGNRYNQSLGMQDSAMVCYSIITDRYTPQMSRADKELTARALNELGVLNTVFYNDHSTAHHNLLQARDISQEIGLEEMEPYILLNLGNLYNIYEFLFPSAEGTPQAGQYYEQSFRSACRLHNWGMAINSYINFVMLNMPYGVGAASVHQEMAVWLRDSIPQNTPDWQLASHFLDGNMAMLRGDSQKALHSYGLLMDDLDKGTDTSREQYMVYTCLAAVHMKDKQYDAAIGYAGKILSLEGPMDLTDIRAETYRLLSEYYTLKGDSLRASRHHTAYLETKEQLMKNIVELVPTQLSHDLEAVSSEIGRMREQKRLQAIGLSVAVAVILLMVLFVFFIARKNRQLNEKNDALFRQMQEIIHAGQVPANTPKYKESQLKEEKKLMLVEEVRSVMGDADVICQPTFTLQNLAERLGSNTSYLSQTINEYFGMNFTSLLNQSRVREACRRMEDTVNYSHLTIDAISESVGFKARVTFTKAFKQNVGMLPSEYIKAMKQK